MTTFETAEIGDKVWSFVYGWGTIAEICSGRYPILVHFDSYKVSFDYQGSKYTPEENQTLFWDEIKYEVPNKPQPKLEVDTKVLVAAFKDSPPTKRYFSHYAKDGVIHCFINGLTSWTATTTSPWEHWELYEEGKDASY